jgi:hypothetical protein
MNLTPSEIVETLAQVGVFRITGELLELGLDRESIRSIVEAKASGEVRYLSKDWVVVLSDATVAMNAILRMAGAVTIDKVPYSDVFESVIKMVKWGAVVPYGKEDTKRGKLIAEFFNSEFTSEVVELLCAHAGAPFDRGLIDFSDADRWISPNNERELDLLTKLMGKPERYAPTSWLCRHMESRPSRTALDYTILPAVPYILKEPGLPARLPGIVLDPELIRKSNRQGFVGMVRSQDGRRTLLEYQINEEMVEGNSFNVTPPCKDFVHGDYIEVNTGLGIEYNQYGKDARKFFGLGSVVRRAFPEYASGETAMVILDKFIERFTELLEKGVRARPVQSLAA